MPKGLFYIFYLLYFLPFHKITAGEITLMGVYLGRSLGIHNPISADGKSFCIQNVYVNGFLILTNPNKSTFKIEFSGTAINNEVIIKIEHRDDCMPGILNPHVIRPEKSFEFFEINISKDSIFWTARGLMYYPIFFIEKLINSNWKIIGSAEGNPENLSERYSIKLSHRSGDNQYRIKCIMGSGDLYLSKVAGYISQKEPITFYPSRVYNKITLSRLADYEVSDIEGNILAKGYEKEILLSYLDPGLYYLLIEDKQEKFIKK